MVRTATRNRATGKVEVDHDDEPAPKARKPRVSHELPEIESNGSVKELQLAPRRSTARYQPVIDAILALRPGKFVAMRPKDGEDPLALKARMAGLVNRTCKDHAPEGYRYATRMTTDGKVVVLLDKAPVNEEN